MPHENHQRSQGYVLTRSSVLMGAIVFIAFFAGTRAEALRDIHEQAPAAGYSSAVPQGENWKSIQKLPDWSGIWGNTSFKLHMIRHGTAPYRNLDPPLNEMGAAKFAQLKQMAADNVNFPSRMEQCVTIGFPGDMDHILETMQVLYSPGQITLAAADNIRRIYTDGRAHNTSIDTFQGDSIGHWESGGVLVVDTVGLDPDNELFIGLKQGRGVHVVERIYRDGAVLVDELTVDAPEVLSSPWNYRATFEQDKKMIMEYACNANRDFDTKTGQQGFDLSLPPHK